MPDDWGLLPSGLSDGDKFRLLFITSTTRNAEATDIATYNRFVQGRAAAGHRNIRRFSAGFRVLGSTAGVDARDNTCTTGTGVVIRWLGGNKVVDDYGDLYDGFWDDEDNRKDEFGNTLGGSESSVWTGSNSDGTAHARFPLGSDTEIFGSNRVILGRVGHGTFQPLGGALPFTGGTVATPSSRSYGLLGLSQVFVVKGGTPSLTGREVQSSPAVGDSLDLSEFTENMMDGDMEPDVSLPDSGDTGAAMRTRIRDFYSRGQ